MSSTLIPRPQPPQQPPPEVAPDGPSVASGGHWTVPASASMTASASTETTGEPRPVA